MPKSLTATNHTITVAPWTTADGEAVLLPRWESINPLIRELFP